MASTPASPPEFAMTGTAHMPAAPDPTVPNVARMYDFMLGGKDDYASDRDAVARLIEISPEVQLAARWNRQFLGRAVRFVASQKVTQFIVWGPACPPGRTCTRSPRRSRRKPDRATSPLTMRGPDEVARMLAGFDLVEPGLVHVRHWRPDAPPRLGFDAFLAAVGRRPG
jgi:S-adenosyl methyltransferase